MASKRRPKGTGCVYKRSNGRWGAQLTLHDGKRISHSARTHGECLQWVRENEGRVEAGLSSRYARMTVGEFLDEWLESRRTTLKERTWHDYEDSIRRYIEPSIGKEKLSSLKPARIQGFYNKLARDGLGTYSIRKAHAILHVALNRAVAWGALASNPASVVQKPRPRKREMKVLTDDQARSFLSAAETTRYGALFFLALSTGMRQGELLGLKWGDIDWSAPAVHIQRQVQRVPGKGLVFVEPKTATSRRTVSLDVASMERLRTHRKRQELERAFAGARWQDHDLIFPSTIGTPEDQRNLVRSFKDLLRALGLPNIRFHDLRHTAATLMLQEDIHPKHVQDRLGHSQISVTLDTYSHVLPPMQKEVAKKIESLLVPIPLEVEEERQPEEVGRPDGES